VRATTSKPAAAFREIGFFVQTRQLIAGGLYELRGRETVPMLPVGRALLITADPRRA
jgi:glutamine synthetase adenylyltransferase